MKTITITILTTIIIIVIIIITIIIGLWMMRQIIGWITLVRGITMIAAVEIIKLNIGKVKWYRSNPLFCKLSTINIDNRAICLMIRVFANGPGDRGSIPGRVIPKTQKMVFDDTLLSTQHYKVRIKGKVEQHREWSSALPFTLV